MNKFFIFLLPIFLIASEQNATIKKVVVKDVNKTIKKAKKDINISKNKLIQKHIKEQMEREKKYAKEKMFYTGKDYNLSQYEVDPDALKHIQPIEPDYDFDMDEGVYSD